MELGKLGVFCFTDMLTPAELKELAQQTERPGYAALWYPEVISETFTLASFLLNHTERLIIATGIANIHARDATAAKQGQNNLAKFSGGRFLLGLGVSHMSGVEYRGHQYRRPLATMRAYLDGMEGAAASIPSLEESLPTVLAALGPRMTELARGTYRRNPPLQRYPRAHSAGPRNPWPGQVALCGAKSPPRPGSKQGARGSASVFGYVHGPPQLPQ